MLAAGEISLSVALLLKHVLSEGNQVELLAAVRGASIRQAREAIAASRGGHILESEGVGWCRALCSFQL